MKRSEMNPKFMWDFTHIYPSDEAWEEAYKEADALIPGLEDFAGKLNESSDTLKAACDKFSEVYEKVEKVATYAFLHKAADSGDTAYQTMEARSQSLYMRLASASAFFAPEVLSIPEDTLKEWLKKDEFRVYRHFIEDISRGREHTLDAARERLLSGLGEVASTPSDAYDMLSDVELHAPDVVDKSGNHLPLTQGNFNVYRESPDRSIREQAFNNMFGTYGKFINTIAALYSGSVKMDTYMALARGYESACHASLFNNNVPISVYDSLIEALHASLPIMEKYLKLRKKALKLDKLDMFDLYVPMVDDVDFSMPIEEGKKLVKAALKPLGEEYAQLLERAYNENWLDVYENDGKQSGAFSSGVYGVHPYVLLNYTDTLDDAYTLAHELGHSMHSYFSDRDQEYINHDYSLLVAEIASTVNEVFVTMHLLETETDKRRRAYVLNHFLEGFRTTVFRQGLFAEFERKAHDMYQAGTPLTAEAMNEMYGELVKQYYPGVEVPEVIKYEWSYIPHFYRAFYVYQYATGFCSAVSIARGILKTGDASKYLKFLTLGGSDYPIEELKTAGLDLTGPDVVANAMKVFEDAVDELTQLMEEI